MALLYDGFLTQADLSNPHKFRLGVPQNGDGNKPYAWFDGPAGQSMIQMGADFTNHYTSDPSTNPPVIDNNCTVIFRQLRGDRSGYWLNNAGSADFLELSIGNSALLILPGETTIFWFCKNTILIGKPEIRNIVLSRNSSGKMTATFRVGTTIKFEVSDNAYYSWLFPWIYPNIRYNSNITGCAGGTQLYVAGHHMDTTPTGSVQILNGFALPSYYDTAWSTGMSEWLEGVPDPVDEDNPYEPGGTSGPDGGDGNFSEDSDDVEEDEMPDIDAVGTGMATIFSPTKGQLKSLSEVFWGSQWWTALQNTIEGIDKMFVSLGIVPFSVTKGSTVEVSWLGLSITEVRLTLASKQFYEFDLGTIDLSDDSRIFTSGSALDYSPFSRLGIYLPFIGFQDLDIDECRGTTINLKYRIDILSGTCVALIKIGGKTIYQFTGNCITQIPITSQNFENMFTNAVNVGIALGTARNAAAVASAGEAVSSEMVQQGKMSATAAALDATQRSARVSAANASLGNATANAMMGMKPDFNKTGSVSASASLLTVKQPFLYLKTPRQCLPSHYQRYCGFPSNITGKLREFSGYTVVEDIRLNGLVATNGEVEEIYDLLKSGVII